MQHSMLAGPGQRPAVEAWSGIAGAGGGVHAVAGHAVDRAVERGAVGCVGAGAVVTRVARLPTRARAAGGNAGGARAAGAAAPVAARRGAGAGARDDRRHHRGEGGEAQVEHRREDISALAAPDHILEVGAVQLRRPARCPGQIGALQVGVAQIGGPRHPRRPGWRRPGGSGGGWRR